ncbi:hypothetical protein GCM10010466_15980 [Planomonospora alba]|uniref:Uncharacterized protein n=1 Tax=Planomonospora alba TaxID=161354 RepID=A0ABP6MUB5_9ACTN
MTAPMTSTRLGVSPPRLRGAAPGTGASCSGALLAGFLDARRERPAWRSLPGGRSPSGDDDPGLTTYELALTWGVLRNRNGGSGRFSLGTPATGP